MAAFRDRSGRFTSASARALLASLRHADRQIITAIAAGFAASRDEIEVLMDAGGGRGSTLTAMAMFQRGFIHEIRPRPASAAAGSNRDKILAQRRRLAELGLLGQTVVLGYRSIGEAALGRDALDASVLGAIVTASALLIPGVATGGAVDGDASGALLVVDLAVLSGGATGTSNEIGWWGPPARPSLPSWYKAPAQRDGYAPGATLAIGTALFPATPRGGAFVPGAHITTTLDLVPGRAVGGGRAPGRVISLTYEDFVPFLEPDPIEEIEELLGIAA